ncbi:MAG: hypothetical protein ACXVFU_17420, partial [Nocardioidaceae bacterium]
AAQAADSDFSSPAAGQVFSGSPTSIAVKASVPACPKNAFGGCSSTPTTTLSASSNGQTLSSSVRATTSAQTISLTVSATSGSTVRANGTWVATLSGGNTGSRTFYTNFDPATPGGPFQVISSDPKNVSFSWSRGAEADLTGYTLSDTTTGQSQDVGLGACGSAPGSGCSGSFYYPSGSAGTHTYTLVASRKQGCPGCSGTLQSGPATTSAKLDAVPSPTPGPTASPSPGSSPAPGTSGGGSAGGTSGGTSGSGSGGTSGSGTTTGSGGSGTTGSGGSGTTASGTSAPRYVLPSLKPANPRQAFALTFNAFAPSLGIPKLPPLPATGGYVGEQPLPLGTYKPSLPYSPETVTTKTTSILSSPTAFVSSIDASQLAKSLATALILLLVGAHVRRFLGTHAEE